MYPEISLGPLTIQSFGLMLGLGFLLAGWIVFRRLDELGRPAEWASEMVFAALIGGLIGARLWWLVENWSEVEGDLLGGIFSGSGFTYYGGLIGGALAVMLWARWRGCLEARMFDVVAPGLAAAYAVGRIGCQLAGDGDYGIAWDGPWAMSYPNGTVPTTEAVHPTPVYETIAMGAVAVLLWRLRNSFRPGGLFALYLIIAGMERLLVEFIRRNEDVLIGLSVAQLVSIVIVIAGAAWFVRDRR